jgi:hypothetical protein
MLPPGETAFITFRLPGTIPAATARELKTALAQAPAAGIDHRHAQKSFFAKFDAVLDHAGSGKRYFENEQLAEVLAGEIMMLSETGFVVHGFAILPNHAHLVLHLPASSRLSFAPAIDLLHQRTGWFDYPVADAAELARILAYVGKQTRQPWPYSNASAPDE